jgi:hypothetical protein
MSDIVERLRGFWGDVSNRDIIEAADEIERLRAVLEPFANAADQLDKEIWDDGSIEGSLAYVTGSHCRAARAALSPAPSKGGDDE